MDPVQFVKDNWKAVAIGFAVFFLSTHLNWVRPEWGIVPVLFGVGAYFAAKRFVK